MAIMLKKSGALALMLVLCSVALGLVSAWLLKEASLKQDVALYSLVAIFGVVATVNAGRFLLWGYIHKYYPISFSYPLSSLFFPMILLMSYYYGEKIHISQICGVILITIGVAVLAYEGNKNE